VISNEFLIHIILISFSARIIIVSFTPAPFNPPQEVIILALPAAGGAALRLTDNVKSAKTQTSLESERNRAAANSDGGSQ
jgi:hypothetical protein